MFTYIPVNVDNGLVFVVLASLLASEEILAYDSLLLWFPGVVFCPERVILSPRSRPSLVYKSWSLEFLELVVSSSSLK